MHPELPIKIEWLQALLNAEHGTNAKITSVKCEIIGEGKGFLSILTKADLRFDIEDVGLPKAVMIKQPTLERMKMLGQSSDVFDAESLKRLHNQEVRAYRYFKLIGKTFPTPRCYYAEEITEEQGGMLILAFMHGSSIHINDHYTLEQAKCVAEWLAKMHADALNRDIKRYFPKMHMCAGAAASKNFLASIKTCKDEYPLLSMSDQEAKKILDHALYEIDAVMANPVKNGYKTTVVMGDAHPYNIFFKLNKIGEPSDEVESFLDFQLSHIGPYGSDLAKFMNSGGFLGSNYQENRLATLRHYHAKLSEYCNGSPPVSLEEVKEVCHRLSPLYFCAVSSMLAQIEQFKEAEDIDQERLDQFYQLALELKRDMGNIKGKRPPKCRRA